MCDLHLPFDKNALQYDVLDWAIQDIIKNQPDAVIFVGDMTCDGNINTFLYGLEKIKKIGIPFLFIPGNSDLRDSSSREIIKNYTSALINIINNVCFIAINDSDKTISEETFHALDDVDENCIVFMHHPIEEFSKDDKSKLLSWKETHLTTPLFYGHLHQDLRKDNTFSLQALDPDKAIGECPCISYYDTVSRNIRKEHYQAPIPKDFYAYFGLSVYRIKEDIEFAIKNKINYLELRYDCIYENVELLLSLLSNWRNCGGKDISIHLPEIYYKNEQVVLHKDFDDLLNFAVKIKANRFTQHVPNISVKTINDNPKILDKISLALAEKLNKLPITFTLGVENMHMTEADEANENRRFGYLPEECLLFMYALRAKCKFFVGINFDTGHARNNAPYSQKYQISTWLSQIGKYCVGYHIHQVLLTDTGFENHMPITDVYGQLISYASFFKCWETNRISKSPVVFEMRPDDAYEITLNAFNLLNKKNN